MQRRHFKIIDFEKEHDTMVGKGERQIWKKKQMKFIIQDMVRISRWRERMGGKPQWE